MGSKVDGFPSNDQQYTLRIYELEPRISSKMPRETCAEGTTPPITFGLA